MAKEIIDSIVQDGVLLGGIWNIAKVEDEPTATLRKWQVYEVGEGEERTRHLIGYLDRFGEGRVTSAIKKFDPKSRSFVTSSGRVYTVTGQPGMNMDAHYVWERWKLINSIDPTTVLEITGLIHAEMKGETT